MTFLVPISMQRKLAFCEFQTLQNKETKPESHHHFQLLSDVIEFDE